MPRKISTEYLSRQEMESLPTKRLLAYRKSLLKHQNIWQAKEREAALTVSKEILDSREHVPKFTPEEYARLQNFQNLKRAR